MFVGVPPCKKGWDLLTYASRYSSSRYLDLVHNNTTNKEDAYSTSRWSYARCGVFYMCFYLNFKWNPMHPTVDKTQDPQRFFVSFMYLSNKSIHIIIGKGNIIWFRYGSRVKKKKSKDRRLQTQEL